jgi:hypothetical protein
MQRTLVVLTFSKYINHGEGNVIDTSKFAEIGWMKTCTYMRRCTLASMQEVSPHEHLNYCSETGQTQQHLAVFAIL